MGRSVRKAYASQESVATTLTAAELAAPFTQAAPDLDPLETPTREAVLADDTGVFATVAFDRRTGALTFSVDAPGGQAGGLAEAVGP